MDVTRDGQTKTFVSVKVVDLCLFLMIVSTIALRDYRYLALSAQTVFIALVFTSLVKINKQTLHYIVWWFFFLLFSLSSYFWASHTDTFLSVFVSISQVAFIGSCMVIYANSKERIDFILKILIIGSLFLCFRIILSVPIDMWGVKRIGSCLGYNPNSIGSILSYSAILSLYLGRRYKSKIYYALIIPLIVFSFLTGSRKAFFIIIIGMSLLLFFEEKSRIRKFSKIILVLILILVFVYLVMNIDMFYMVLGRRIEGALNTILYRSGDASSATRLYLMQSSINTFYEHPLIGSGLDAFRHIDYLGTYAHNNYLELLSCLGIVGMVFYYSLPFVVLLRSIVLLFRGDKNLYIVSVMLVTMLLIDFAVVSYTGETHHIIFSVIFAIYSSSLKKTSPIQYCSLYKQTMAKACEKLS